MKTKMSPVWVWIVTSLLVVLIWGADWFSITQWGDMTNAGGNLQMQFKSVGGAFVSKNCEVAELQNFKSARFPQGLITPGQPIDITVAATGDAGMANLPRDFSFSLDYITPNRLEGRIRFKVQGANAIQVPEP